MYGRLVTIAEDLRARGLAVLVLCDGYNDIVNECVSEYGRAKWPATKVSFLPRGPKANDAIYAHFDGAEGSDPASEKPDTKWGWSRLIVAPDGTLVNRIASKQPWPVVLEALEPMLREAPSVAAPDHGDAVAGAGAGAGAAADADDAGATCADAVPECDDSCHVPGHEGPKHSFSLAGPGKITQRRARA